MTPQAKVRHDSQMRGVIFFRTRLLGTSLHSSFCQSGVWAGMLRDPNHEPDDIGGIEYCEANVVLVIRHSQVCFEIVQSRIADIGPVQKRAEKENGQHWDNSRDRSVSP